jgi:hypothetical protein
VAQGLRVRAPVERVPDLASQAQVADSTLVAWESARQVGRSVREALGLAAQAERLESLEPRRPAQALVRPQSRK